MRFIMTPALIVVLTLTLTPDVLSETGLDSYLIFADETEKKKDKKGDEKKGAGDEEPECE